MIINETRLTRQIKRAYSHGGYTVAHIGDSLAVYTDMWFIMCPTKIMPRKALAAIVEHTGTLPERGTALEVHKGADPQTVIQADVEIAIREWISANTVEDVTMTLVTYKAMQIFQAEEEDGYNCYGTDLSALEILEYEVCRHGRAVVTDRNKISWSHDGTQVVLRVVSGWHKYREQKIWETLESVDLKPKDETEI